MFHFISLCAFPSLSRRQCFKAAWLAAVLHDGHHFPENFDHFQSVSEIDHSEVQWTLGALVYNLHRPSSDRLVHVIGVRFCVLSIREVSHDFFWSAAYRCKGRSTVIGVRFCVLSIREVPHNFFWSDV